MNFNYDTNNLEFKKNKIKNPMKNKINLNKLCENPIKLLTDVMVKK